MLDPFAGGTHTVTLDGTKTAQPIWKGRAWIEEIEADGPNGHWEGATLFLYNPKSGQWSQTYLDSDTGEAETPTIGSFKDGRGELISTETYQGRTSLSAEYRPTSSPILTTLKSPTRGMAAVPGRLPSKLI